MVRHLLSLLLGILAVIFIASPAVSGNQPYNWYIHEDCRVDSYTEVSETELNGETYTNTYTMYYYYDSNGKLIKTSNDSGDDGSIEAVTRYFHDESGRISKAEYDSDNDGRAEGSGTYYYRSGGKLEKIETDNDVTNNTVTRYYYDSEGKATEMEYTVFSGNESTSSSSTHYYYDADGKLDREEFDSDTTSHTTYYYYDSDGKVTEMKRRGEAGNAHRTIEWTCGYSSDESGTDGDSGDSSPPDTDNPDTRYLNKVQKVYMAYYLRPADPAGLEYWAGRLQANNGNMAAIIDQYANSEEAFRLWGEINGGNIETVIDAIYQGLFNRPADAAGRQYYAEGFRKGDFTAGTIVLDILNGATGEDAEAIANKLSYCNTFVSVLDPDGDYAGPFQATYNSDDAAAVRRLLKNITSQTQAISRNSVEQDVVDFVADPGDPIMN